MVKVRNTTLKKLKKVSSTLNKVSRLRKNMAKCTSGNAIYRQPPLMGERFLFSIDLNPT